MAAVLQKVFYILRKCTLIRIKEFSYEKYYERFRYMSFLTSFPLPFHLFISPFRNKASSHSFS